jgi:hypothetical protein
MPSTDVHGNLHSATTGQFTEKPPLPKGAISFDDLNDELIRTWNFFGFTIEEAGTWNDAGFEPHEASEWCYDTGFELPKAQEWREAGFTAKEAESWDRHGFSSLSTSDGSRAPYADEWRANGFNARAAEDWYEDDFRRSEDAREWLAAGVPSLTASDWLQNGFTPDEAGEWCRAGIQTVEEMELWTGVEMDLPQAKQWRKNGFYIPEIAHTWSRSGLFSPEEAKQWNDAGFTPNTAAEWSASPPRIAVLFREAGLSPERSVQYREKEAQLRQSGVEVAEARRTLNNKYGIEFKDDYEDQLRAASMRARSASRNAIISKYRD